MNNAALIHIWVTKHVTRLHGSNLHVQDNQLLSYATPIAEWVPERQLYILTRRTYSNTTSRHQSTLRREILGAKVLYVDADLPRYDKFLETATDDVLTTCLRGDLDRIASDIPRFTRAKSRGTDSSHILQAMQATRRNIELLRELFPRFTYLRDKEQSLFRYMDRVL